MGQKFSHRATHTLRLTLLGLLLLPCGLYAVAFGLHRSSYATDEDITIIQPVPFSHLHHVGDNGLDCRYCHGGVDVSPVAGMPSTHTCMTCHSQIWRDAPVLAPVRASAASGEPIRWARVYRLPDFVFFDHAHHVRNGVGCTSCHGDIDHMPLTRKAKPMTMQWCLSCHRDPAAQLRPESEIFSVDWTPPKDQAKRGAALMAHYHIDAGRLTDCTVCHR